MYLFKLFVLLLCAIKSQQSQDYRTEKYNENPNSEHAANRIIELMRSYYEEANVRITELNEERFMYEESPFYEQGYIMGEILERFRKLVEHTKHPIRFHVATVIDTLKRVEFVQKLYFEIYHLVRMMHEAPRKWSSTAEFMYWSGSTGKKEAASIIGGLKGKDGLPAPAPGTGPQEGGPYLGAQSGDGLAELQAIQKNLEAIQKRREREKRRTKKLFDKLREAYLKGLAHKYEGKKEVVYNKHWPLDYGWEIQDNW